MNTSSSELLAAKGKGAQTARGHRRRALILKVASELFASRGYDGVSINDIGAAAGISGPGIYRYFLSKEAMLAAIFEHIHSRHQEAFSEVLGSGKSPEEMLETLIDIQIALATEEPEKIRILMSAERYLASDLAERLRAERRHTMKIWSGLLREARPELSAEEANITVHGMLALVDSISRRSEPMTSRLANHLRGLAMGVVFGTSTASSSG